MTEAKQKKEKIEFVRLLKSAPVSILFNLGNNRVNVTESLSPQQWAQELVRTMKYLYQETHITSAFATRDIRPDERFHPWNRLQIRFYKTGIATFTSVELLTVYTHDDDGVNIQSEKIIKSDDPKVSFMMRSIYEKDRYEEFILEDDPKLRTQAKEIEKLLTGLLSDLCLERVEIELCIYIGGIKYPRTVRILRSKIEDHNSTRKLMCMVSLPDTSQDSCEKALSKLEKERRLYLQEMEVMRKLYQHRTGCYDRMKNQLLEIEAKILEISEQCDNPINFAINYAPNLPHIIQDSQKKRKVNNRDSKTTNSSKRKAIIKKRKMN